MPEGVQGVRDARQCGRHGVGIIIGAHSARSSSAGEGPDHAAIGLVLGKVDLQLVCRAAGRRVCRTLYSVEAAQRPARLTFNYGMFINTASAS